MMSLTLPLTVFALIALQISSEPLRAASQTVSSCGADQLQDMIGKPFAEIDMTRVKKPNRVLRPGQIRTMDYIPSRTNIDLDGEDVVTRIWCG